VGIVSREPWLLFGVRPAPDAVYYSCCFSVCDRAAAQRGT